MKKVTVGDMILGEGRPKVCVPIMGKNADEIRQAAEALAGRSYDLVEWRLDWLENIEDFHAMTEMAAEIKKYSKSPLLATFRSEKEGGRRQISFEEYAALNRRIAKSGIAELADIELFYHEEKAEDLIKELKHYGVKVVVSSHDFQKTPDFEELWTRLCRMEAIGADVAKLAVMPESKEDVLRLLQVTARAEAELSCPVITMSMGKEGVISRVAGEFFGSCLTFGMVGKASAPGQIEAEMLTEVLEKLHKLKEG